MSCWRSDDSSYNGARTPTQENATESVSDTSEWSMVLQEEIAPEERVNGPSDINEYLGDGDSEAETVIPEAQSLNSDDWLSLERQFPINKANSGGTEFNGPQNVVHSPSVDHKGAEDRHKAISYGARSASSAVPMGVRKSVRKRNKSSLAKSVTAAVARQAAEAQLQNEPEGFSEGKEVSQRAS